jgi:hypothetical protein
MKTTVVNVIHLIGILLLSEPSRIRTTWAFVLTPPPSSSPTKNVKNQPFCVPQRRCWSKRCLGAGKTALQETSLSSSSTTSNNNKNSINQPRKEQGPTSQTTTVTKTVAVLLCPAQFCVPPDYDDLWQHLPNEILVSDDNNDENMQDNSNKTLVMSQRKIRIDREASRVVPLSRRDWIKVSQHLPTSDFWRASLRVHKTLDWYFEAIEQGLSEIFYHHSTNNNDSKIDSVCLVGHSIGGWVARAYLGGLSRSSSALYQDAVVGGKITSLITLGTPHSCPPTALVDQTRGLLQEIATTPECSSSSLQNNNNNQLAITCVCSSSLAGKLFSTNVEEVVAASSYWSLLGPSSSTDKGVVLGDGIVPLDVAFMEAPARRLELSSCPQTARPIRHSHVLPTPWKLWGKKDAMMAPSIALNQFDNNTFISNAVSYVSPDVVPLWSQYIR